ncbi:MAG: hypothetical protein JOZ85_03690 [Betaproteobacteria bacterium]|nr:hypothetical protein [Betaproteobacteria bacterium]
MKKFVAALLLAGTFVVPALARNIAVPASDPAAMIKVPDTWAFKEIEYGYSAVSPGKDVFFSVESADRSNIEAMKKANNAWMKENGIDVSAAPVEMDVNLGGLSGKLLRFDTKDENGPTRVEFVILPVGKGRIVFLTLWGSEAEQTKHEADINAIMGSVKAIQ